MKTYIKTTLTILISGMLFSSCEDQLNQANPNQATEDTFWKDETDFNLALTSCYTPLKNALNGGYYGTRGVMLRIARADEVDFRNDISDVYTVNRFTNSNTNSLTQGMFYQFYNALYRTNSIMQKLEEKKEQFSTDFQNSVKGECLFIRGFYLFQLAKEFKDAPLRLTASQSPSTFPLAKSSQADIWAQAKEDLKTAASLLPITNKIGKPTQGAAYAALGKIYVYEENWQEAINVLEPLTQNPYTYKLVEDFNWNFDDTHENNAESIFELLIEDVGGTDLWGDGENINSTQSNTRPKEYAAAEYEDSIPQEVKQARLDELMSIQQGISGELSAEKVGRQMKVIIDRLEGEYYIGRTEFDSPEVDPEVLIERGDRALHIGNFYHVEIVNSDDFDLFGRII